MTAFVIPDIDRSTLEDLKKRIPDLTELELPNLPKMKDVGRTADQTIDKLLGRRRAPVWPWIAAGIVIVAVIGAIAAWFAWFRRPTWQTEQETWDVSTTAEPGTTMATDDAVATNDTLTTDIDDLTAGPVARRTTPASRSPGLTAAESSLASTPYSIEDAG